MYTYTPPPPMPFTDIRTLEEPLDLGSGWRWWALVGDDSYTDGKLLPTQMDAIFAACRQLRIMNFLPQESA